MGKEWIKLHVNKWLEGSTRNELTPGERSVWVDLLVLAGRYDKEGKSEGLVPINRQSLCRILNVHPTLFDRAIKKFLEYDKITITDDGSIKITNWNHYNPSRWEIWAAKHPDEAAANRHKLSQTNTNTSQTLELEGDRELELDKEIDKERDVEEEDLANIIKIYEENIGMVTPLIGDQIKDALSQYPASWVGDAIKRAVDRNKRSWGYIEGILRSWHTDGKDDGVPKSKGKKDRDKFIEGGYSESVCRTEEDAERLKAIREDFKRKRGL